MSNPYEGSPREIQSLATFSRLLKTAGQLRRRVYAGLNDARLTESQLSVLELLLQLGPLPQKDIARHLMVTGGNVTMVVDNLQKRHLVERNRWPEDRRVVHVGLTPAGKETIESYFPRHVEKVARALEGLKKEEQERLVELCDKLRTSLQEV